MLRKWMSLMLALLIGLIAVLPVSAENTEESEAVTMYRLYNPNTGQHLYTANVTERVTCIAEGWRDEGIGWYAPESSDTPVYRVYNPNSGDHHYTTDEHERDVLVSYGWNDEGIGWYSDDAETVALYRAYNPNAVMGSHHYTANVEEKNYLVSLGWQDEGIGWYGLDVPEEDNDPYTYEVYALGFRDEIYDDVDIPIYVKTDNPNGKYFRYYVNGQDVEGPAWKYYDVSYHLTGDDIFNSLPVDGGYIGTMNTVAESGEVTFELREYAALEDGSLDFDNYEVRVQCVIHITDMRDAESRWVKNTIKEAIKLYGTDEAAMNPKEKLDAVAEYLTDGRFTYRTNDGLERLHLAGSPDYPYFLNNRWDSMTSPNVMCDIANEIGGFEEVHSMFNDYEEATEEWYDWHHYMYVVYEGEKYYYTVCPLTETGYINRSDIHILTEEDMTSFYRIY